jgi:hypothetical protein
MLPFATVTPPAVTVAPPAVTLSPPEETVRVVTEGEVANTRLPVPVTVFASVTPPYLSVPVRIGESFNTNPPVPVAVFASVTPPYLRVVPNTTAP